MIFSAKNKRMGKTGIFFFGLAVLLFMIIRVFKSGAKSPAEYLTAAKGEIKQLGSLSSIALMVLGAAITLIGFTFDPIASSGFAVLLGVLTTADTVVTTFNSTFVPKFVYFVAATQLKGLKLTVQGDGVIYDSDASGLSSSGVIRQYGQVSNGYCITLANGLVTGKNCIWEFTNSAAQTPSIYVGSDSNAGKNPMYLQMLRQAILANSGQNFTDFATLALPSLGSTDVVNILYNDGTNQQFNRAEIQAYLNFTQNINASLYTIDNFAGRIKTVNVLCGTSQTAYVQRWVNAGNGGMVNQSVNN